MNTKTTSEDNPAEAATRLVAALKDSRLEEAEAMYQLLCASIPESELLVFRVFIWIQQGRALDALRLLNEVPEEQQSAALRAICLHLLNDPTWHAVAESLEGASDPAVRLAMQQLLQRPAEPHASAPAGVTVH